MNIKKINKYSVVSFDIFDTLIERNVPNPTDIFKIVGRKVLGESSTDDFYFERIKAEKIARDTSITGEVTLDDIYARFSKFKDRINLLKETEENEEISSCYPKAGICNLYAEMLKNHEIVIISDMYLSSAILNKMLLKCGYNNYKKIYVSNENGCNKISGKLFDVVIDENNYSRKEIIHIGDSIRADFLGARKAGVSSILIRRKNGLRRILNK